MLKYEELKAKDLSKQAIIIEPSQTLYDVRSMMIRYNISRVIIAKDNKPLGIITEKDIARFLYKEVPNRRLNEISVNEIMNKDLIKVEQQTNLDICAMTMLEKEISSIVVVDNEGELKGIITKSDMVEAYARHYPSKLKVDYLGKDYCSSSHPFLQLVPCDTVSSFLHLAT
jgi:CBS domain-containing protein